MNKKTASVLHDWHDVNFEKRVDGRHLTFSQIEPLIQELGSVINSRLLGTSFEGRSIYGLEWGDGPVKILMWTQMHGNETTGTRALFDLLKLISDPGELSDEIAHMKSQCSITMIPILNPDGSEQHTRISAQGIDLNRDVIAKEAPESRLLQHVLQKFDPDYCFNLHDQRTLFSVGEPPKPATISFLAPSVDESREVTEGRKETMRVVVAMNNCIKHTMEGHIGRYTDEFYPTATGDNFEKMGYHTVLIESGHFKGDYSRDVARKATFMSIVGGLLYIADKDDSSVNFNEYFDIPNNEKNYRDVLVENTTFNGKISDIAFQFEEKLIEGKLHFLPRFEEHGDLAKLDADKRIDGSNLEFDSELSAEKWAKNRFN